MGLSPPFVMSLAVSSTGAVAAGTADGRLLIGFGAEAALAMKKRPKKWEGLDGVGTLLTKIAEGPVVALYFHAPIWLFENSDIYCRAFVHSRRLVTSTLNGVLTVYDLVFDPEGGSVVLNDVFKKESSGLDKANALLADGERIILAGLTGDGKGVIEIWKQEPSTTLAKG
jgi:hypothetical protein